MGKFNKGDRVRLTEDNNGFGIKGDTGFVESPDCGSADCYVRFDRLINDDSCWYVPWATLELADWDFDPRGKLKLQAGRYYKTRDGRKVGPMRRWNETVEHPWEEESERGDLYRPDGSTDHGEPLIAEWVDEPAAEQPVEPKFKVGDRVVAINSSAFSINKGDVFVVTDADDESIRFIGNNGEPDGWCDENFELVTPATTTPAIVALIESGQPKPATRPFVHPSKDAATAEAARLAKKHPGKQFGVYELVATKKEEPQHEWQKIAAEPRPWSRLAAEEELMRQSGIAREAAEAAVSAFLAAT